MLLDVYTKLYSNLDLTIAPNEVVEDQTVYNFTYILSLYQGNPTNRYYRLFDVSTNQTVHSVFRGKIFFSKPKEYIYAFRFSGSQI